MILRGIGSRGNASFIAFYSCTRPSVTRNSRSIHTHSYKCTQASNVDAKSRKQTRRNLHSTAPLRATAKDPYKVLGVAKDASAADIKKIYFNLARKYHPDTNKDESARDKFVEIQDAYDILKDEQKRSMYDKYGAASTQPGFDPNFANAGGSFGGGGFGFQGGFNPFGGGGGMGGMGGQQDLFDQLFGAFGGSSGGPRSTQNPRGGDIEASLSVSFLEACKGLSRTVEVDVVVDCTPCKATGLKPGAKRSTCTACNGTGTRTFVIQGGFHAASTCSTCSGTGTTIPKNSQCKSCAGLGKVREHKSVSVNVPPGVDDGMVIRVPKQGDSPINGSGSPGDLHVRVNVAPSKVFRRQGINLHHDARIPWHTAVLGGRVRVPTLDGEVDVKVPSGTQQGEAMVLRSRGVPSLSGNSKGDLIVDFAIQIPRSTTPRQREILQAYVDDLEGRTPAAKSTASPPPTPTPAPTINVAPSSTSEPTTELESDEGVEVKLNETGSEPSSSANTPERKKMAATGAA